MPKKYELNDEMMSKIIAEAHRLSNDGKMPTMWQWKQCKSDGVPSYSWIEKQLSWSDFADKAGLEIKTGSEKGSYKIVTTGYPWYDLFYAVYAKAVSDSESDSLDDEAIEDAKQFVDYTQSLADWFEPSTIINGWGRTVTQ